LSFEPVAAGVAASEDSGESQNGSVGRGLRRVARRTSASATAWTPEPARREQETRVAPPARTVTLGRVPREKAASILPQFAAGSAPLRAMMDRD
jgi:hypothetical protein